MTRQAVCRDCKRPLRSSESQLLGYGPDCARKRGLTPPAARRTAGPRVRRLPAAVPPAPDTLPGQTELDLFYLQPTLDSL